MAFFRESLSLVVAVVVVVAAFYTASGMVEARMVVEEECPEQDTYVYPYWSTCHLPAQYETGYYFVAAASPLGGLVAEWDETNSTYYVRFTGDSESRGDLYAMTQVDKAQRAGVATHVPTLIYNTETKRQLGWRQEGEDDYFLVEVSDSDPLARPATFMFTLTESVVHLPCPLLLDARCEAYDLDTQKYGLLPIHEEGATYIKAAPKTDEVQPFVLMRSSSAYIKQVIQ